MTPLGRAHKSSAPRRHQPVALLAALTLVLGLAPAVGAQADDLPEASNPNPIAGESWLKGAGEETGPVLDWKLNLDSDDVLAANDSFPAVIYINIDVNFDGMIAYPDSDNFITDFGYINNDTGIYVAFIKGDDYTVSVDKPAGTARILFAESSSTFQDASLPGRTIALLCKTQPTTPNLYLDYRNSATFGTETYSTTAQLVVTTPPAYTSFTGTATLTDAENGEPLKGATFELVRYQGQGPDFTTVATGLTTNDLGQVSFSGDSAGLYEFRQTAATDGYVIDDTAPNTAHQFTVMQNVENQEFRVSFNNTRIPDVIEVTQLPVLRTVRYEGAGADTPADVVQTVTYEVVTNKTQGTTSYTPQGSYAAVDSPVINNYTADIATVEALAPATVTEQPADTTVNVTYTPVQAPTPDPTPSAEPTQTASATPSESAASAAAGSATPEAAAGASADTGGTATDAALPIAALAVIAAAVGTSGMVLTRSRRRKN